MAKINNYPELPGSGLALADVLPIDDASASFKTKKVSIEGLDIRYVTRTDLSISALDLNYVWISAAARIAETGMVEGEWGFMSNTASNVTDGTVGDLYQYVSAAWVLQGRLLIDGSVLTSDLNGGGNQLINWQTLLNSQVGPSAAGNGTSSFFEFTQVVLEYDKGFGIDIFFKMEFDFGANQILLGDDSGVNNFIQVTAAGNLNGKNSTGETFIDAAISEDREWHGISISSDGAGLVKTYLDGVPLDSATITADLLLKYIFRRSAGYGNFSCSNPTFWNRARSTEELKKYSSSQLAAVSSADEGASKVALNTTTAENGTGIGNRTFATSFTGASATGFTGTDTTDQGYGFFPCTIKKGKKYRLSATLGITNGTAKTVITSTGKDFAADTVEIVKAVPVSDTEYEFTAVGDASYVGWGFNYTTGTMEAIVSNFSIVQLGVTAHYPPEGLTEDKWVDVANGNDADGTDITIGNKPVYAELDCRYYLKPPRLTTTEKNALTAVNGMIVNDTTLNKIQGFENGAWTSFI